ncbi:MAG: helix-turn-helix transcriptional regulator [Anaerolineales bacterium]|nr:helix-turn-helix transcriptional regulator [Anaerolineales bacterium]
MPDQQRGDPGPCRKRRRRGMRLILRPSLLLMLAEKETHGYELYDQLASLGFDPECIDSSILYRDLRDMEDMGLIGSRWDDEESKGPKRRVYRILDVGKIHLGEWIENLESIQNQINRLIKRYKTNQI